jgi:hypothetical protein
VFKVIYDQAICSALHIKILLGDVIQLSELSLKQLILPVKLNGVLNDADNLSKD